MKNKFRNAAHLIIDVQRVFCDPDYIIGKNIRRGTAHTHDVAQNIANLAPVFRNAVAKTVVIFQDPRLEGSKTALGGFYLFKPDPEQDLIMSKGTNSAFKHGHLASQLRRAGINHLLISGFNAGYCVRETAEDALRLGFAVTLIEDCIGQDNDMHRDIPTELLHLTSNGAQALSSDEILYGNNDAFACMPQNGG